MFPGQLVNAHADRRGDSRRNQKRQLARSGKRKCDALQTELLNQVEMDEINFLPLAKAYGIPKDDPNRDKIMMASSMASCVNW